MRDRYYDFVHDMCGVYYMCILGIQYALHKGVFAFHEPPGDLSSWKASVDSLVQDKNMEDYSDDNLSET